MAHRRSGVDPTPSAGEQTPIQLDSLFEAARTKLKPAVIDTKGLQVLFAFLLPPYNAFGAALARYDSSLYPNWEMFHAYAKS